MTRSTKFLVGIYFKYEKSVFEYIPYAFKYLTDWCHLAIVH